MQLFRHKLVKALLAREKISPRLVEIMRNWSHPGFSVFQGERINPDDHEARRHLAGYPWPGILQAGAELRQVIEDYLEAALATELVSRAIDRIPRATGSVDHTLLAERL